MEIKIESQRSRKNFEAIKHLISTCFRCPGTHSVYVAPTRSNAEEFMWNLLHWIDTQYDLGIEFNNRKSIASFPNGSTLEVTVMKSKKARGE